MSRVRGHERGCENNASAGRLRDSWAEEIARALREQIDWDDVRERSADTPFGRAFFVIAEGLEVVPAAATDMGGRGSRWSE